MGQEVGVTPIQLVSAVSAIANGGMLYKPHIVQEVRHGENVLPREGVLAPSEPRRVIQPETAATLAAVDGRRGFEWDREIGAFGWMDGGGEDRVGAED